MTIIVSEFGLSGRYNSLNELHMPLYIGSLDLTLQVSIFFKADMVLFVHLKYDCLKKRDIYMFCYIKLQVYA